MLSGVAAVDGHVYAVLGAAWSLEHRQDAAPGLAIGALAAAELAG